MWPYFSEDDAEEVTRAVYTIENPFHENFQDLSEFSSELRISDHVFEVQVRFKPGVSVKQQRVERPKTVEIVEPIDPKSLKTNSRIINSKTPSTPAGKQSSAVPPRNQPEATGKANATTSKPNANATNRKPDANPPRPVRRPDVPISASPLQNSHQNTKSSPGWNQPPPSAKSTANPIRPNPASYQPDYRSNVFKQPAPMCGLSQSAASHRPYSNFPPSSNPNLVTIQTDQRSAGAPLRQPPPGPRLAFGHLGQSHDIRLGTNQSENFQCRNINYNANFDPRKPPPMRNSACALDPRMQNNYSRAAPKPAQIAANDPRMRANRTETRDQLQADANKRREELQRKDEELRRKEEECAMKERELEMTIGTKQRRSGSDAYALSITGSDTVQVPTGKFFSIAEFQKSQTSSVEEDVRPKKSDYEALSEILKSINKEKTPDKADESTKNGLPIVLDTANSVARAGGAPKPAGSTGASRRVTMVRSNQPAAVEPSKKIRLDHPYSKSDGVNTDSDDSVLGSPVSTDTADTVEMELDPAIESIVSSKIDAAMRRSDDQDGTDLEAKLRKLLE